MQKLQLRYGPWAQRNINTFPKALFALLFIIVIGGNLGLAFTAVALYSTEKTMLAIGALDECNLTCGR